MVCVCECTCLPTQLNCAYILIFSVDLPVCVIPIQVSCACAWQSSWACLLICYPRGSLSCYCHCWIVLQLTGAHLQPRQLCLCQHFISGSNRILTKGMVQANNNFIRSSLMSKILARRSNRLITFTDLLHTGSEYETEMWTNYVLPTCGSC